MKLGTKAMFICMKLKRGGKMNFLTFKNKLPKDIPQDVAEFLFEDYMYYGDCFLIKKTLPDEKVEYKRVSPINVIHYRNTYEVFETKGEQNAPNT